MSATLHPMQVEIKHRWTGAVLYACEVPQEHSGMAMCYALEKAVAIRPRIVLRGADLSDADLSDADLRDAVLRGAVLRDTDLSGAVLSGADLSDADGNQLPRATPAQAIENLDKVRAIVMDNRDRLNMGHWHGDNGWKERTCAEETLCGTTHCMAGWLQVCSTEPALKEVDAYLAGVLAAPVAAKMFYRGDAEALAWLESRAYVAETEEAERRAAERAARKAGAA